MRTPSFTGERMIPAKNNKQQLYFEHMNRYLFASSFVKEKRVLDLACGVGYGSRMLKDAGAKNVFGVDISEDAVKYAKAKYGTKGITFIESDATSTNLKTNVFDVVVCFEFIEHVANQDDVLKEIKRLLKKDGVLIISTPNKRIYPDKNKFHKKELDYQQFNRLLTKYFKNVNFWGQYFWFSNLIANNEETQGWKSVLPNRSLQKCHYFLAVCSNKKIGAIKSSMTAANSVDGLNLLHGPQSIFKIISDLNLQISQLMQVKEELKVVRSSKFYRLWRFYCSIKESLGIGKRKT